MTDSTRTVNNRGQEREQGKEAVRSPWKMAGRRLRRHNLAMAAMVVLIVLHVFAIFADFWVPYGETETDRRRSYHPPTRVQFFDDGSLTRPYVYGYDMVDPGRRQYEIDEDAKYEIQFFAQQGQTYELFGIIESNRRLFSVESPGKIYLVGADQYGRDIFSRLAFGARRSLFIGLIGIAISTTIGMIYGGVSGFFGGWVDNLMMRISEVIISIPAFYLLLALSAVLPANIPSDIRFMMIIGILSFIGWAGMARVIRGMVLSIRQQEFVHGAEAIGCSQPRIILRHILPNTLSYVIVNATLAVPGFILSESGLSLIGVGIQHPQASWGNMLSEALNLSSLSRFPWLLIPGFMIFITVLSYSFFGDGVRDAFDPRASR